MREQTLHDLAGPEGGELWCWRAPTTISRAASGRDERRHGGSCRGSNVTRTSGCTPWASLSRLPVPNAAGYREAPRISCGNSPCTVTDAAAAPREADVPSFGRPCLLLAHIS